MDEERVVQSVSRQTAGIAVAVISSLINGSTFVLHKKGLQRSEGKGGRYGFLLDAVWWSGTVCMIVGQLGNLLAYNMAPVVIVTPLGALGVLFGAMLASRVLQEHLNILGKLACVLCCCGSVILLIHSPDAKKTSASGLAVPEEKRLSSLELEELLQDKVFLGYALLVALVLVVLIVWVAPAHGRSNIMVYVSICSLLGTFTVPSCKGLGPVAREVFGEGGPANDRVLALFLGLLGTLLISTLTQFFFITEALKCFSSSMFEAIYFVMFTPSVIVASALLFKEWTGPTVADILTILCALITVCVGVVLLRISQGALITWKELEGHDKRD